MSDPVSDPIPAVDVIAVPVPQSIAEPYIDSGTGSREPAPPVATAVREPKWPAHYALITAWLFPATSARRMQHVPLWLAWFVHVAAGVLTFLLVNLLATLPNGRDPLRMIGEIVEAFMSDPATATLVAIAVVGGIEFAIFVLALVLTPWGARDERLRSNASNGLRCVWLQSTHALPVVLLFGIPAVVLEQMNVDFNSKHTFDVTSFNWPTPPTPPANATPNSPAMLQYEQQQAQYEKDLKAYNIAYYQRWSEFRRAQPFLVRYQGTILTVLAITMCLWITWALFRGVTVRDPTYIARPPMCEFCGYNLTVTPMDSTCPECGTPVIRSLGPDARNGTRWERGSRAGLARDVCTALFAPRRFGQNIRVTPANKKYLLLLFPFPLLAWLLCGFEFMLMWYIQRRSDDNLSYMMMEDQMVDFFFGQAAAVILFQFAVSLLLVLLVTLYYRWQSGRNLGSVASQIMCYQSGYFLWWELLVMAHGFAVWMLSDWFSNRMPVFYGFIQLLFFFLAPHVLVAGVWLLLIARATAAARYANR